MTNWNNRYLQGEHGNQSPHRLIVEYSAKISAGRALDLACGLGRHALFLAGLGWQVTAVDSSEVAIRILEEQARVAGVEVDARVADLEMDNFKIAFEEYDLILVTCYLQRDLFPKIRAGLRPGGIALAVIATVDDDPLVKAMNPDFLLQPGELRGEFAGWELLHDREEKAGPGKRRMAEIVARKII